MSDHHSRQSATSPGQWPYPPIAPRRRVWPWVLGTVAVLLFVAIVLTVWATS